MVDSLFGRTELSPHPLRIAHGNCGFRFVLLSMNPREFADGSHNHQQNAHTCGMLEGTSPFPLLCEFFGRLPPVASVPSMQQAHQ